MDWREIASPLLLGILHCEVTRGKEIFSFEASAEWAAHPCHAKLDPDFSDYGGIQYPSGSKQNFGLFLDSSPDRWGRLLIKRREAVMSRIENRPRRHLTESDFLLGVYDNTRMGALRFKLDPEGDFLDNSHSLATPPWASLRELEHACTQYESGIYKNDSDEAKWIRMIFAPGSSLGGARPKASIRDAESNLWIAKFPSRYDEYDIGAWEMVAYRLATQCGITMSTSTLRKFGSRHHTFLTKRFDRTSGGGRLHFASAMTMLGKTDGDDDASYLDLAEFLHENGSNPDRDMRQLWTRMTFNIAISNCDDHLRNHGFILTRQGWELSPAYDINPSVDSWGLKLNIDTEDNALDYDLAISVAPYFSLTKDEAAQIAADIRDTVSGWRKIAQLTGIAKSECDYMSSAFHINR